MAASYAGQRKPESSFRKDAPITFVFLEVFGHEGGIQSYVQDVLRTCTTVQAHRPITVLALRDGDRPPTCPWGHEIQFVGFKTRNPAVDRVRMMSALWQHLRATHPGLVVCGHINLAPVVGLMAWLLRLRYAVMTYGKEVWNPLPLVYRWALRGASQVWTISRYTGDRLCHNNKVSPQRVYRLPCMVDGDRYSQGTASPQLLDRYGLAGCRVLLTVARLWVGDPYKGVDMTLRALPQIVQHYPTVKYLVIGRGNDQPRLAELAASLGVADRVVFAGFVPVADLVEHYRLADLYVMPSQEGFGIVYLEAMACGVPVVSGDADGSADPLMDGELGWRVPHRDVAAVADACINVLAELDVRQQGGEGDRRCDGQWLRQRAIAQFGQAAFGDRLQNILSSQA
ncbi:MAG: glycosyltransferase family 4 protein [Kaiparowitsia implicata GSE-PSE-MK54-09C]|jgi:glycosyltransferase involved in cell wall biosynthesis|nr:glycosyltransferase family 4 protein [Kaiparowitsia implicata GSE-PSE-MK54-09C]